MLPLGVIDTLAWAPDGKSLFASVPHGRNSCKLLEIDLEAANELKIAQSPGSDAQKTGEKIVNRLKSALTGAN